MIENAQRLQRLARRIGFGTPTVRDAGGPKQTVEFHLPDNPPRTMSRRMASAVVLVPEAGGMKAVPPFDYEMAETTIRFPQAPEAYYEQSEVRDGAEAAIAAAEEYPSGNFRFNPVVEEYAIHYDIPEEEMRDRDPEEFLRATWAVGETFNREMEDAY